MNARTAHALQQAPLVERAGDPIAQWLLAGPAQLRGGAHAGAVAGCVDTTGHAAYVYPEITGYYLQWLAWRSRWTADTASLAERAQAAQCWLRGWLAAHDPPRTRIHIDGDCVDWRNRAVFCFDLAMVLRGLAAAANSRLLDPDATVVAGISRQLDRMIARDRLFAACVPHQAGATLPARWSTRRGGFLAKAAAGIITAAHALPGIPEHIVQAAEATYVASLRWVVEAPHDDVHPMLYAFEGTLSLPQHPRFRSVLPAMASQFDALLAQAAGDGTLPETLGGPPGGGPARVDVIAQALRIGHLLRTHRPQRPPDRLALARLQQLLAKQVRASGAVPFAIAQAPTHWNVWAAMFSDQALGFAHALPASSAGLDIDPLLV